MEVGGWKLEVREKLEVRDLRDGNGNLRGNSAEASREIENGAESVGNGSTTIRRWKMKNIVACAMVAFAALVVASCKEEEAGKECVLGCAENEVCVAGDCETTCETSEDCFATHGGGWHCEHGDVSYCAIGAATEPTGEIPECVAEKEVCDGVDNDCDGVVDNGVKNACGKCGAVPSEVCDGVDNDCDGKTDEGLLNACGKCGPVPSEVCDGVDNDCDGKTDEGLLNACGKCGAVPAEVCDGVDNDCDGKVPDVENDADADGYRVCDGDCNDADAAVNPGATELCNGIDDNCNGMLMVGETDADADSIMICEGDCDDADKSVYLDAVELCNAVDDDCDGLTDEDFFVGVPCIAAGNCGLGKYECAGEFDYRCSSGPNGSEDKSVVELCSDNIDNDCDGSVDEGCSCDAGDQKVCGSSNVGECELGWQICGIDGEWNVCVDNVEASPELCDGLDTDCDGALGVDEVDADGDGFMVCESDCDDADALVNPDAAELCNGVDDDCDGDTDEDYFVGAPCSGYGACGFGEYECAGEIAFRCSTMPGGSADQSSAEICSDNIDNNCEGSVDEGCACEYDAEEVVFIICGESDVGECELGTQECQPDGVFSKCVGAIGPAVETCDGLDTDCDGALGVDEVDADGDGFMVCESDCDDADALVNPAAAELCNAVDERWA
ncbi:putative metal-binding motif-containing protein [Candidatus Falkowbacteria bacterium]|nr:putative metal-binding motif-containing protein [Candidatus Falkowbacteria bacterium]